MDSLLTKEVISYFIISNSSFLLSHVRINFILSLFEKVSLSIASVFLFFSDSSLNFLSCYFDFTESSLFSRLKGSTVRVFVFLLGDLSVSNTRRKGSNCSRNLLSTSLYCFIVISLKPLFNAHNFVSDNVLHGVSFSSMLQFFFEVSFVLNHF